MALQMLTPRQVQTAGIGIHNDGGGLFLAVTERGSSWVFRYTSPGGKRREMGMGPALRDTISDAGKSVANARKQADRARSLLAAGVDPIDARRAERDAEQARAEAKRAKAKAEQRTLARVAREYHAEFIEDELTDKHAAQWIASLERNVPPEVWHKPIDEVGKNELFDVIKDMRKRVPETAARVRQRLESVFDYAVEREWRGDNPALLVRKMLARLQKGRKAARVKKNFAALPYAKVPAFVDALRGQPGIGARMLEFALLTAARTGEVLFCTWGEIDLQQRVWRVPGERMKGGEDHVVYLPERAVEILQQMRAIGGKPYVFPSPMDDGKPMSNMAMLAVLRRMKLAAETTVHGVCRSSFSTWAYETGVARDAVIEACLAHQEQDRVKAAYNRSQFNAERAALLRVWADFCDGKIPAAVMPPSAEVIPLQARAA